MKCQVNRAFYQMQGDLFQLLPIPSGPWHNMCMDLIKSLTELQGYDAIFVDGGAVCQVGPHGADSGNRNLIGDRIAFLKRWLRHYKLPRVIVSDRAPKFTSAFWKHFSRKVGMKLRFSTAFLCKWMGKRSV